MQVPLDFPAIASMVGLGAVVGRRLGIRPKRHDDWTVVPNLFGGIVGRPGLLKTPALQEACRPLIRLEMAAKDEFKRAQAEYEAQQRIDKQQKKLQDDKIAKDLKSNRDPKGILHDLLAAGDEDPPPVRRRYVVNDSTIEKLGEILSHNPNGVLIFRDELTGFLRQMERDGHEQDRAFYLEAWNGTGRFTYDRIGRGTIDIEACCVSLLGGIQPESRRCIPWCAGHRPLAPPQSAWHARCAGRAVRSRDRDADPAWVPGARRRPCPPSHRPRGRRFGRAGHTTLAASAINHGHAGLRLRGGLLPDLLVPPKTDDADCPRRHARRVPRCLPRREGRAGFAIARKLCKGK